MAAHHRRRAPAEGLAEGQKFRVLQQGGVCVVHRQVQMGIGADIAVAGIVLDSGQNAARRQAHHHGAAHPGHRPGIVPEGADADDRVQRLDVHVQHRGEVHVDAHGPEHPAAVFPHLPGPVRAGAGGQGQGPGEQGRALGDAAHQPALLVGGDKGGKTGLFKGQRRKSGAQAGGLPRGPHIAGKQDKVAHLPLLRQAAGLAVHLLRGEAGDEHLPDLMFQRGIHRGPPCFEMLLS